jgi:hypothetical protein
MLTSKKKTYFTSLIFLAGMILLPFVSGTFLIDQIRADSEKIKNRKIALNRLDDQKNQINRIRENYYEKEDDMKAIEGLFLDPEKTVDFIIEIENISEKAMVELEKKALEQNIAVKNDKNEPSVFNYQLTAKGKFNNIMHFLTYLENMNYSVIINNLKIKALSGSGKNYLYSNANDEIEMSINLGVYILEKTRK